ncbi:hypothetical protein HK104_001320 [Borealophlyctis nickersoniae]|nr:hypothetical protein HK104_001320 [Borealophlyctis nickersoniae]
MTSDSHSNGQSKGKGRAVSPSPAAVPSQQPKLPPVLPNDFSSLFSGGPSLQGKASLGSGSTGPSSAALSLVADAALTSGGSAAEYDSGPHFDSSLRPTGRRIWAEGELEESSLFESSPELAQRNGESEGPWADFRTAQRPDMSVVHGVAGPTEYQDGGDVLAFLRSPLYTDSVQRLDPPSKPDPPPPELFSSRHVRFSMHDHQQGAAGQEDAVAYIQQTGTYTDDVWGPGEGSREGSQGTDLGADERGGSGADWNAEFLSGGGVGDAAGNNVARTAHNRLEMIRTHIAGSSNR